MIFDHYFAKAIKKALGGRGDGSPTLPYWTAEELGMSTSPFEFYSGRWKLRGFRYWMGNDRPKGVAIFFHGLGSAENAYTKQIALLAKQGYLVYAYDNTASGMSEGDAIPDLTQTLLDQKAFFDFLDKDKESAGLPRIAMGHSWGGFTALCALQPEYHVEKVVSFAGFHSVIGAMLFSAPSLKKIAPLIVSYQKRRFKPFGGLDALDLMKKTEAKVLYIQGDKDEAVSFKDNFQVFEKELKDRPNIVLLRRKGYGHMPYWTKKSEEYFHHLVSKEKVSSFDRDPNLKIDMGLLNQSDPEVEQAIIDFLKD